MCIYWAYHPREVIGIEFPGGYRVSKLLESMTSVPRQRAVPAALARQGASNPVRRGVRAGVPRRTCHNGKLIRSARTQAAALVALAAAARRQIARTC